MPPLPPHITPDQAKALVQTIIRGDPDTRRFLRQTLKDLGDGVLPRV